MPNFVHQFTEKNTIMKKQNIKKFINEIKEITDGGDSINDEFDVLIRHIIEHDNLGDELGFKNTMNFIFKLKQAFKKLDG